MAGATSTRSSTLQGTVHWEPDSAASSCSICRAPFRMMLRRHHCRACGRCVCARCSLQKLVLRGSLSPQKKPQSQRVSSPPLITNAHKRVRVCDSCVVQLHRERHDMMDEVARAAAATVAIKEDMEEAAALRATAAIADSNTQVSAGMSVGESQQAQEVVHIAVAHGQPLVPGDSPALTAVKPSTSTTPSASPSKTPMEPVKRLSADMHSRKAVSTSAARRGKPRPLDFLRSVDLRKAEFVQRFGSTLRALHSRGESRQRAETTTRKHKYNATIAMLQGKIRHMEDRLKQARSEYETLTKSLDELVESSNDERGVAARMPSSRRDSAGTAVGLSDMNRTIWDATMEKRRSCRKVMADLESQLSVVTHQHKQVVLRSHFPDRSWMLRLCADDGMYIGARVLKVNGLSCAFRVLTRPGCISLEIQRLSLNAIILDFAARGSRVPSILKIFRPSRMVLRVTADRLYLPVVWIADSPEKVAKRLRRKQFEKKWHASGAAATGGKGGTGAAAAAIAEELNSQTPSGHWELGKDAQLALNISKEIKGSATVPDVIVRQLVNIILQRVLKQSIREYLPRQIVPLTAGFNNLSISGFASIASELSMGVWEDELAHPDSAESRYHCGITTKQAVIMMQLCKAAKVPLLDSSFSMRALHRYLLTYMKAGKGEDFLDIMRIWSEAVSALETLCDRNDGCSFVSGQQASPSGASTWLSSLFSQVYKYGLVPMTMSFSITHLDLKLDMQSLLSIGLKLYSQRKLDELDLIEKAVGNPKQHKRNITEAGGAGSMKLPTRQEREQTALAEYAKVESDMVETRKNVMHWTDIVVKNCENVYLSTEIKLEHGILHGAATDIILEMPMAVFSAGIQGLNAVPFVWTRPDLQITTRYRRDGAYEVQLDLRPPITKEAEKRRPASEASAGGSRLRSGERGADMCIAMRGIMASIFPTLGAFRMQRSIYYKGMRKKIESVIGAASPAPLKSSPGVSRSDQESPSANMSPGEFASNSKMAETATDIAADRAIPLSCHIERIDVSASLNGLIRLPGLMTFEQVAMEDLVGKDDATQTRQPGGLDSTSHGASEALRTRVGLSSSDLAQKQQHDLLLVEELLESECSAADLIWSLIPSLGDKHGEHFAELNLSVLLRKQRLPVAARAVPVPLKHVMPSISSVKSVDDVAPLQENNASLGEGPIESSGTTPSTPQRPVQAVSTLPVLPVPAVATIERLFLTVKSAASAAEKANVILRVSFDLAGVLQTLGRFL